MSIIKLQYAKLNDSKVHSPAQEFYSGVASKIHGLRGKIRINKFTCSEATVNKNSITFYIQ